MTKAEQEALRDIDPRMKDQAAMVWKIEKAFRKKAKTEPKPADFCRLIVSEL